MGPKDLHTPCALPLAHLRASSPDVDHIDGQQH